MKRTILTMIIAACASLFTFTSCEKAPEDLIVGSWDLVSITMEMNGMTTTIDPSEMSSTAMNYTFRADGTFTASSDGDTFSGNYTLTDGNPAILNLTVEETTQPVTIKQLDKETLVLYMSESDEDITVNVSMTFKRI